jgi:hypothetical protein
MKMVSLVAKFGNVVIVHLVLRPMTLGNVNFNNTSSSTKP